LRGLKQIAGRGSLHWIRSLIGIDVLGNELLVLVARHKELNCHITVFGKKVQVCSGLHFFGAKSDKNHVRLLYAKKIGLCVDLCRKLA
jgi:hypothetical protein